MKVIAYAILQDKREVPLDKQTLALCIASKENAKMSDMLEIPNTDTNQILFHGETRLVKEFRYVDVVMEEKKRKEDNEKYLFEKNFSERNKKKQEWTKNKLIELQPDEIEYFQDMANHQMDWAIRKNMVWPKHLKERAMCLIRKHFNCPYA